ncbi:hypothetical protein FB446DRAFT_790362 [Lentinula raphanica]|nr:hypothetical protein FB446DRAFT_790362 [Lentinula raphanica]
MPQHSHFFELSPFAKDSTQSSRDGLTEPSLFVKHPVGDSGQIISSDMTSPIPFIPRPSVTSSWKALGETLPPLVPKHTKQVMFRKLYVTPEQQEAIADIYARKAHFTQEYTEDNQREAVKILVELGLDPCSRKDLESRWSIQNSTKSSEHQRILFQCGCGYNTQARQNQEEAKDVNDNEQTTEVWERKAPYPFTACLAHIEIIEKANGAVTWIAGVPDHNEACRASFLERRPPVPLHEHVYQVALEQLQDGAR